MFKKLLPLLFLFAGFQANATLIDNGDYSTDNESGLDWLDWTLTADKTQAEALTLYSSAGWRIATTSEAVGLIENHFDVGIVGGGLAYGGSVVNLQAKHTQFASLFGVTYLSGLSYSKIEGFGLIGSDGSNVFAGYLPANYGSFNQHAYYMGVALVKAAAVSEPAIIALFALGVVGIGFARRRQS
jgi:hypothetical protein